MPGTKLWDTAQQVCAEMRQQYVSYGKKVEVSVDEHDGTPKVYIHITRPTKSIPHLHFRHQGIVVNIVVTR